MIIDAEIINQPYSGIYTERIYDNQSAWNSQSWTFIKFSNEDYTEWVGHFRGFPREVSVSTSINIVLVLTSDYLFELDRKTGSLLELESQPQYHNLTVSPYGDFILADYYNIEIVRKTIKNKELIESPIEMDMIEFQKWNNGKLDFSCDECLNWDRHLIMSYDYETNKIEIKSG